MPRRYRVHVRWTSHTNRPTDAPYTIYHDDRISTVCVNQQLDDQRWMPLGTFDFSPGGTAKVVLSDHGNGIVSADAIRFEKVPRQAVRTVAADPPSP